MTVKSKTRPTAAAARGKALKISYQGEPGANSHIACNEMFPKMEPLPCPTFEDALAVIKSGEAQLGMIPIENSIAGRVADVHHLLPASGLHIVGEHFLPIRFQMMAIKGAKLDTITDVYSHVHAIGQCRKFMRAHNLKPHVAGDTAGAARQVMEWNDPTKAALAPRLAADVYGLDILAEDVEDAKHNTTRFVVLSREPEDAKAGGDAPIITTIMFRVRNVPAALYKAMGGFATNGVNITKLESYMTDGSFTATMFYAEFDGHPQDANVARALEELQFFSSELRILGAYPASKFRPIMTESGRSIGRR
jgi:prephenate dehydratase